MQGPWPDVNQISNRNLKDPNHQPELSTLEDGTSPETLATTIARHFL